MATRMTANERIGFIGLGLMGHGIAKNIVEKGYPLTFLGRSNRAPAEDMIARGAREASTAAEVAAASSIVFICVTGSRQVEEVIRGPFPQPSIDVTYSGWGLLTGPTGCKGGASIAGVFGPGSNTGQKGAPIVQGGAA